jgi:DNA primase
VSDNIFQEITENLDLEFLFDRESLPFKMGRGSSGMQINAKHCPDCGDSRYRVYLNADTGQGNCFVCNQTYNKAKFVKLQFGYDNWRETIEKAKEIMREQGWRPKRMATVAVDHGEVKLPYSTPLPTEDGENLVYLENRGITAEYARYFELRYCQYGSWPFRDEKGDLQQQWFSNRVIIPVYDLDGTLKTFQGRDLTMGEAAKLIERKYLFPKGLPGTGKFLLNGQNVQLTDEVCMGEGAFDVAAIKIAFDEDVDLRRVVPVGSFGKHLSYGSATGDDQLGRFLQLKRQGIKTVTIMWDGEPKALIAALDAAKLLTSIGLKARIALLPYRKDPNEVVGEVTRKAYYAATLWTPSLDVKWRLRNPYAADEARWKAEEAKKKVSQGS